MFRFVQGLEEEGGEEGGSLKLQEARKELGVAKSRVGKKKKKKGRGDSLILFFRAR